MRWPFNGPHLEHQFWFAAQAVGAELDRRPEGTFAFTWLTGRRIDRPFDLGPVFDEAVKA
jgi:hypothetical protein